MALEKVGVRATIEGLAAFESGMRRMNRAVQKYGDEAKKAARSSQEFSDGLRLVGIALTATAAAGTALIVSSVRLAARVQTLGVVTARLGQNVGRTEGEIRDLEQAIVSQGITLRASRQAIARMIQANIDLSHSTDLARLAQDAAVIANMNSSEAFQTLVNVIVSGNVRMARTIGIQARFGEALQRTADAAGVAVEDLTDMQIIQARTNEVLEQGANIAGTYEAAMETVGKQVLSLDRLLEESKSTLGEAWLPVYARVVQFVSDSLKWWLALPDSVRNTISIMLGLVTALTGVLGIISLFAVKLPMLVASFNALATAVAGTGTIVFSAGAVLLIYAAAIIAVVAAVAMLIKTVNMIQDGFEDINRAIEEQNERMFELADTYDEYRREMERVGDVTNRVVGTQDELNRMLAEGEISQRQFNNAIVIASNHMFEVDRLTREVTEGTSALAQEVRDADRAMLGYAQALMDGGRSAEELNAAMNEIQQTIQLQLTDQFTDFQSKVEDLNAQIEELEGQQYLTSAQEEDLARLRAELEETQAEWSETTATIIFELAQQRLAIDGFTEEEIRALARLAGPEGLGLIDEAAVALIDRIDSYADELAGAGDQSREFADRVMGLQGPLTDAAADADNLAAAIRGITSKTVTVTVVTNQRVIGGGGGGGGTTRRPRKQFGGFVQANREFIANEQGPEAFVSSQSGNVISNNMVNALANLTAAIRSMPLMSSPMMASPASNSTVNQEFNLNIQSRARVEPIIGDFAMMQGLASV